MNACFTRRQARVALSLGALCLLGCSDSTLQVGGGDLSIELSVTPTTQTAGVPVDWTTSAVGTSLLGTVVEFGDGMADSAAALGAQSQSLSNQKIYDSVGVYTVIARIEDSLLGESEDTVTVEIVAPST